ncbi:MAG TPA: AraC family transcriptional regulator [Opitutaceae bacterium]
MARENGFSQYHFIRLYKAVFGETPHQCQSATQIEKAKHLLILSDASVTEVCMAVGFSSVGSFSTLFKRRVGVAPSAFQRRHRVNGRPAKQLPPEMIPGCLTLMGRIPPTSAISKKPAAGASAKTEAVSP